MSTSSEDMLADYDRARLGSRYWLVFGLLSCMLVFELFDFFIVGFLMSSVAPLWHLSFLQTAVMLLSTGIGAMIGAVTLGKMADRFGRKRIIVAGGMICSLASAAIALVGDRQWELFSALRFLVGIGYGAAGIAQFSLIIEFTPTRLRTFLSSAAAVSPAIGLIFASFLAANLFALIGWRGLALASGAPVLLVLLIWAVIPESFRWLISQGRFADAARSMSWILKRPVTIDAPARETAPVAQKAPVTELYREPRKFWLILLTYFAAATGATGVYLWGPTLVAQLLGLPPGQAAGYFMLVGVGGLVGRILLTGSASWFGRKPTAIVAAVAGGGLLIAAGLLHEQFIGAIPVFLICLIAGAIFYDGAFANLQPYAGELYPVRLGGRAMGLSQVGSGAGKLAGPAILAVMAGSSNLVAPKAISDAVLPGFVTLGLIMIAGGVVMALIGQETRGAALAVRPQAGPDTDITE